MPWNDFHDLVQISSFGVPAAAQPIERELSSLCNKVGGANAMVRAIDICFVGSIVSTGTGYWFDVLSAKLPRIALIKDGKNVWDLSSQSAMILEDVEGMEGPFAQWGTFTAATWYVRKKIRITFLDSAFCNSKDDGLVPVRALHDATLILEFAADNAAYPMVDTMQCFLMAELSPRVGEYRKNYVMEYKSDKIRKDNQDLRLPGRRQYHRLMIANCPNRTSGLANNDYYDTIFNITGDNTFVDHKRGDELQTAFFNTNRYMDQPSQFYLAAANQQLIMQNHFQPLLWPRRDGGQGDTLSKAYSCFYRPLIIGHTATANTIATPWTLIATWLPVLGDQDLATRAAELGLAGRTAKVRTLSKKPVSSIAARILPNKVV